MTRLRVRIFGSATCAAVFLSLAQMAVGAIVIDTVHIGSPNNPHDQAYGGNPAAGGVSYEYSIGKYEVTNAQYVAFLNDVDPDGTNSLNLYNTEMTNDTNLAGIGFNSGAAAGSKYSAIAGRENDPTNWVSFWDAARFANWMNNGQSGPGTTEDGAYTLNGNLTPANGSVTRNPGATWFIPNEDEWYKAAYYDPNKPGGAGYWLYPTKSDDVPYSAQPPGAAAPDPSNTANFFKDDSVSNGYDDGFAVTLMTFFDEFGFFGSFPDYFTNVGIYTGSESPWGTFDQGGNVNELLETIAFSTDRVVRGASFIHEAPFMAASGRLNLSPSTDERFTGFRLATIATSEIPEPSSFVLAGMGFAGLLFWRRRRKDS